MHPSVKHRQRVENILLSLKKLDFLNRSQLQTLHDLKSARNANRILNSMSDYLSHFLYNREKVYYLNKEGRDMVLAENVRKRTSQIEHYLLRNQLYIELKRPANWQNEMRLKNGDLSIVSDAVFDRDGKLHFVEVDCQQSMQVNARKIEKYRQLMNGSPYRLIWITKVPSRKRKLARLCQGLAYKIYTEDEVR